MKKILFATTALVATAGIASADVDVTGMAEMGIMGGTSKSGTSATVTSNTTTNTPTQFFTDIDVTFTMSGEANNGITFGATVDLDETSSATFAPATQGGETIWVAYGAAKLTMGDTDGALDAAMQEVALAGGSLGDNETGHAGYNGNSGLDGMNGGQVATFSYSMDSITGYVSASVQDASDSKSLAAGDAKGTVWGVGVKWSGDLGGATVGVGIGHQAGNAVSVAYVAPVAAVAADPATYTLAKPAVAEVLQRTDSVSITGISLDAAMDNGFSAAVNYSTRSYASAGSKTETHSAIGIGYAQNALALGLNYGEYSNKGGVDGTNASGWGFAASYDLGGGLSAKAGYGTGSTKAKGFKAATASNWTLGLGMKF